MMKCVRNIFACLIHESPECVIDLVRNLNYLDPSSLILLYNGGKNPGLLETHFPIERYGAVIHPRPHPMIWGKLHDFALDCMRFALENYSFDTLTIVDSDQLAVGGGYSGCLAKYLAGREEIGLLGKTAGIQPRDTKEGPAAAAYREVELWQPFLQRFPNGEEKFVHWTFWPSTVFTAEAARELVALFAEDAQLKNLMRRTRIWATEEVIFPTLVALLGFKVAQNPCSYDYVNYQTTYDPAQIATACDRNDVYWMHPITRKYDNPNRKNIRMTFNHYTSESVRAGTGLSSGKSPSSDLLLRWPIFNRMKPIKGWLEEDEADLLMAAAAQVLAKFTGSHAIVEVGSYCGRSTVVLGSVVKALGSEAKVYAIDPHHGRVGAMDQGIKVGTSTLKMFRRNIAAAELNPVVEEIQQYSYKVRWDRPIQFLLIDGLHDYINVARDFYHFEPWIAAGGYVAFHDYADYYPGVKSFVNEIIGSGRYRPILNIRSMMVIERLGKPQVAAAQAFASQIGATSPAVSWMQAGKHHAVSTGQSAQAGSGPLVSCIMPTADRRRFVTQAIRYYQQQDYHPRELIIVDDGQDPVSDLIPADSDIHYIRLEGKTALGRKRNTACEAATGDIIVHWDDDDWMADWRLSYQIKALLEARADVCGLDRLMYYQPGSNRSWLYSYPKKETRLLAGGSLCYFKRTWQVNPFAEINLGEDTRFIWSERPKKLLSLKDNNFYIALIHAGNTNPRNTAEQRWQPCDTEKIQNLIGEDWQFYQTLNSTQKDPDPGDESTRSAAGVRIAADEPLVSCIMPTSNRRLFLSRAITYFRRQTYPNKELIIVDDGTAQVADLIPRDDRIRYIQVDRKATVGFKRNYAVQHCRGDLIAHWDDDDWYAAGRLRYQIEAMQREKVRICGLQTGFFYDAAGGQYWSCSPALHAKMFFANVNGRSILYARALWQNESRYPDVSLAEDAHFLNNLQKRGVRIGKLKNQDQLVYIRHFTNAWHFECGKFMDPAGWRKLQTPPFLPAEDAAFYQNMRKEIQPGSHETA